MHHHKIQFFSSSVSCYTLIGTGEKKYSSVHQAR